jgi:diguanylate cyclase (GGDEF)-like protein/PAS domain S-box-containing protein
VHFFLPLFLGTIIFLFTSYFASQNSKIEEIANSRLEQLAATKTEVTQLRMRLVDVERRARSARREAQRLRLERCTPRIELTNKFETTFHATPDSILLADMESGLVTDVNESFLRLLDYDWNDVYNNPVNTLFTWANEQDAQEFATALITGQTANNLQAISQSQNRADFFALVSMRSVSISGKRTLVIAVRDCSDLHAAHDKIRTFSTALEQSPVGTAILSSDGCVEHINTRFAKLTGYTAEELHGNKIPFFENLPEESVLSWENLATKSEWHSEIYAPCCKKGNCWFSISISPVTENGKASRYVLILEDITKKKAQERHIQHMAMHDGLTGVANRRHFKMQLKQSIELQRRSQIPFALIFMDLNKFKEINDTRGHDFGDEVLKKTASRLKSVLREVDLVARPGGDEFLLLLSGIQSMDDLQATLTRIAYHTAQQVTFCDNTTINVTAAMGVALCPEHGTNADDLLSKADHAMYACKRTESSPFVVWEPSMEMNSCRR